MEIHDQIHRQSGVYIDQQTWKIMGRIYRRFPFLTNTIVVKIIFILLSVPAVILLNRWQGECTCADQIPDKKLEARALRGDSAVLAYLKTKDNTVMCAARRAELTRKLEKEETTKPRIR